MFKCSVRFLNISGSQQLAPARSTSVCSVIVLVGGRTTATLLRHLLAAHAARAAATERRRERKVDVLLAVHAHKEGGDGADLLSDTDVTLTDQGARMVNGLRKPELEDLRLEAP